MADLLCDDLLLHLVRAFSTEHHQTEWFPPRRSVAGTRAREVTNLGRVMRFSLVARAWQNAAKCFLRSDSHRSVDARRCPLQFVCCDRLQSLVTSNLDVPKISTLTALSIHGGISTNDSLIASMLRALGSVSRLRSLGLPRCERLAFQTFDEIAHGHACSSTLNVLDLTGLASYNAEHLPLLSGCTALRRVNLGYASFPLERAVEGLASARLPLSGLALDGGVLEDGCASIFGALSGLQELSLRGVRTSVIAISLLVRSLPRLAELDLRGSEVWGNEADFCLVQSSLEARPQLTWLGAMECSWLTHRTLLALQAGSGCTIEHALAPVGGGVPAVHQAEVPDSWEELELLERMPTLHIGSSLAEASQDVVPAPSSTSERTSRRARCSIDYSSGLPRRIRSIYHVSQGSQPYYSEADALPRRDVL